MVRTRYYPRHNGLIEVRSSFHERKKRDTMTSGQVSLSVNDTPINLDNFVRGYIELVVDGILASLKGTEAIKEVTLTIEGDHVSIVLNDAPLPLNPFATRIIRNTLVGMISTLHGVHTIERMQLNIKNEAVE